MAKFDYIVDSAPLASPCLVLRVRSSLTGTGGMPTANPVATATATTCPITHLFID